MSTSSWHTAVVAIGVVALGTCTAPLRAQKPGQTFVSPLKNFRVVVPKFFLGTKVQKKNSKEGGTVSFTGGAGHIRRIDYMRLPAGITVPTAPAELQDFYRNLLQNLLRANPSTLLVERSHALDDTATLLAVVSFPSGSHMQDAATGTRQDSLRGILIFARGGFAYMLHEELLNNIFNLSDNPPPPVEELSSRAETRLSEFYRGISFQ